MLDVIKILARAGLYRIPEDGRVVLEENSVIILLPGDLPPPVEVPSSAQHRYAQCTSSDSDGC